MLKGKKTRDPLSPTFEAVDDFVKFWDSHSTADYPEAFRPVKGKVRLQRRRFYRVSLDASLGATLDERARAQGLTLDALVNRMLQEQLRRTT